MINGERVNKFSHRSPFYHLRLNLVIGRFCLFSSLDSLRTPAVTRHFDATGFCFLTFCKAYAKNAVVKICLCAIRSYVLRQCKRPRKRAIRPFNAMIIIALGFLFKLPFATSVRILFSIEISKSSRLIPGSSASIIRFSLSSKISTFGLHAPLVISSR